MKKLTDSEDEKIRLGSVAEDKFIELFSEMQGSLPKQKGKAVVLKDHQEEALNNLESMRSRGETIALLYHATGTGKTITAVTEAKKFGKRTVSFT